MRAVMGIDVGTSSVKVALLGEDGSRIVRRSDPYPISRRYPGWAEQDPLVWWEAVESCVADTLSASDSYDIVAVGLTGQMHSLVCLDEDGNPLRPAILWCDKRASHECVDIERRIPDIADVTGNRPIPAFTLPQLLWLREHEPHVYARVHAVALPKDYIGMRLTGRLSTEPSDAAGTAMFDISSRTWATNVLETLDIPAGWLPATVASNAVIGPITAPSPRLQRLAGCPVVAGAGDQAAQAVAFGVTEPDALGISLGTSGVVLAATEVPVAGCFCHAQADRWLRLDSLHTAGACLAWYAEHFHPHSSIDEVLALAASAPPGSAGLTFLPFLAGARSRDAAAPAGFVGVTTEHGPAHFARAVIEGVTYEFARMVQAWWLDDGLAAPAASIAIGGGGARSELWAQTIADIFQTPVRRSQLESADGAAKLAMMAIRWPTDNAYDTITTLLPDAYTRGLYEAGYHRYTTIVGKLIANEGVERS